MDYFIGVCAFNLAIAFSAKAQNILKHNSNISRMFLLTKEQLLELEEVQFEKQAPLLTSPVTSSKLYDLSAPQFPHLKIRGANGIYLLKFMRTQCIQTISGTLFMLLKCYYCHHHYYYYYHCHYQSILFIVFEFK